MNWSALAEAPIMPPMIPNKPKRRKTTAKNFENFVSPQFSGLSEFHDPVSELSKGLLDSLISLMNSLLVWIAWGVWILPERPGGRDPKQAKLS